MIYDALEHIGTYKGISKHLDIAIDFICSVNLEELPVGKTAIDEENVFVNVMEIQTRPEDEIDFEVHKKYLDIHIDIQGKESVAIGERSEVYLKAFDNTFDFGTVKCSEKIDCLLGKDKFIICMADEPHKPGIMVGEDTYLKKAVFKVIVE